MINVPISPVRKDGIWGGLGFGFGSLWSVCEGEIFFILGLEKLKLRWGRDRSILWFCIRSVALGLRVLDWDGMENF